VGVDEAGRGPWAGPVVAAAVAVGPGARRLRRGVTDSKQLSAQQREQVYEMLTCNPAVRWSVATASHKRIDRANILRATLQAMARAVRRLDCGVAKVLIDGNHVPAQLSADHPCEAVVGGDRRRFVIAAASIIAKVTRDRLMTKLDKKYPQYGFAVHKGYGTALHRRALVRHGVSKVHRCSFEPIKGFLKHGKWGKRAVE